jgi:tRNA dimethylallyltransferase
MNKLLVISGPTATGKTDLALQLAAMHPADLVSADSRQVYRGMDIGTGKDIPPGFTEENSVYSNGQTNIYGYDLVMPWEDFSLGHYIAFAQRTIKNIWSQHRLPIVVGGTGLYIKGVIHPPATAAIPQNPALRQELELVPVNQLSAKLQSIDSDRYKQMNESDKQNPRRLGRAIEVADFIQKNLSFQPFTSLEADVLQVGLTAPLDYIDQKIEKRVASRLENSMVEEVRALQLHTLDTHLPSVHTLGYEQITEYIAGRESLGKAKENWITAEKQYARRQLTWFKKQSDIQWFDTSNEASSAAVVGLVAAWYSESK